MGSDREQESPRSSIRPFWILEWDPTNGNSLFSAGLDGWQISKFESRPMLSG